MWPLPCALVTEALGRGRWLGQVGLERRRARGVIGDEVNMAHPAQRSLAAVGRAATGAKLG